MISTPQCPGCGGTNLEWMQGGIEARCDDCEHALVLVNGFNDSSGRLNLDPPQRVDVGGRIEVCSRTWTVEEYACRLEKHEEAMLFLQEVKP